MSGASAPYYLLKEEFIQRKDEGCEIPNDLVVRFRAIDPQIDSWNNKLISPIYDELMLMPEDPTLAKAEPNDLESIRKLRPDGPRDLQWKPSEEELIDQLHGAWTGRCVGCALGKPVELLGMERDEEGELKGRKAIKNLLVSGGDWPLSDYFPDRIREFLSIMPGYHSLREHIQYMEADDDIHYSLVGLGVLERHGSHFTWENIARYWLANLNISGIWTAEIQAIMNLLNVSRKGHDIQREASWIRRYRNPYREWIGAQIRSDGFAFACAGHPELAAEFAWRDAHWTHERNGIYGEMMFAAMQAAAFVESDPKKLIQIGLSEIPEHCRLAQWVRKCLVWTETYPNWEACMDKLEAELGEMHATHTINNALICVIALIYGHLDTTLTPSIAVMCGLDTDCNGATVGSIVGASAGRKHFGGNLCQPLNDTVKPNLIGVSKLSMHDLAERSAKVWKQLRDEALNS